jgi:hypothetical protein
MKEFYRNYHNTDQKEIIVEIQSRSHLDNCLQVSHVLSPCHHRPSSLSLCLSLALALYLFLWSQIILHLTEIMGLESAILPPHGFNTSYALSSLPLAPFSALLFISCSYGLSALIHHHGVFQLLDKLSPNYRMSPVSGCSFFISPRLYLFVSVYSGLSLSFKITSNHKTPLLLLLFKKKIKRNPL